MYMCVSTSTCFTHTSQVVNVSKICELAHDVAISIEFTPQ